LKRLLAEEGWREFETVRGEVVRHERFEEFVTLPPLKGLGTSVGLIKRIVADDREAVDLLDRALQELVGRPKEIDDNVNNIEGRPTGNSQAQALRRLRKDAPELHAEVIAGRLSAHAAMVKAGLRTRTISVPVEHPDRVAAALRRHMTQEQDEPPGTWVFLVVDEPPSTSPYRPRRASSRRATGKPNALDVEQPTSPTPSTTPALQLPQRPSSTSHGKPAPGFRQQRKALNHMAEGFHFRATCRSALHHGFVYVAVVDLDADALAAELAGDFLSHGDGAVTTAPAGNVHTGEDGLYLKGVHCDESADSVHIERDDAIGARRRQDVVADHRVKSRPVAHVGVGVRVAQCVAQVNQQYVALVRCGTVKYAVGGDYGPDHWYSSFAT